MSDDNKGERKPVAAAMMQESYLVVVCDDGSVWRRNPNWDDRGEGYQWEERLPIPGTRRAREREGC